MTTYIFDDTINNTCSDYKSPLTQNIQRHFEKVHKLNGQDQTIELRREYNDLMSIVNEMKMQANSLEAISKASLYSTQKDPADDVIQAYVVGDLLHNVKKSNSFIEEIKDSLMLAGYEPNIIESENGTHKFYTLPSILAELLNAEAKHAENLIHAKLKHCNNDYITCHHLFENADIERE